PADGIHPLDEAQTLERAPIRGRRRPEQQPRNGTPMWNARTHTRANHFAAVTALPCGADIMGAHLFIVTEIGIERRVRRNKRPGSSVPTVDLHAQRVDVDT